jgi:nitrite reductase/ring-hydroxylating ferredoxin subunit
MFITAGRPTRSVRTTPLPDGGRLLIVGGEGRRVGQEPDTDARYAILEGFMREYFDAGEVLYRWSTQDAYSVDGLPYVGRIAEGQDLFVATGFAAWGMTNGSAAGLALASEIAGEPQSWAEIFALERHVVSAAARDFLRENVNIAVQEVRGALRGDRRSPAELAPGEAAVLSLAEGDAAVYRDPQGVLHTVSATCTHMGCEVAWNPAEASWDCSCHGSRFTADGAVLHGPALRALAPVAGAGESD